MSDDVLDPELRSLLDLGRDELGPDPETIARLRGKIETAALAAGAGVGIVGLAKTVAAKSLAVKLAIVASVTVATGAVIHVVDVARRDPAPIVAPAVPAPAVKHVVETPLPPAPPRVTIEAPVATPPPAHSIGTVAPVAPPPRPHAPPKAPAHATLARETELVDLATRALREGDFAAVHAAVMNYTREAGGAGQLAEEIDAIEVEALCRAHDETATHKLAAFDARWPHAGQRHRLSAACQGDP